MIPLKHNEVLLGRGPIPEDAFQLPLFDPAMTLDHADYTLPPGQYADDVQARRDWSQSYSGKAILLADPDYRMVSLYDVAMQLADIHRYNGSSHVPWNVADHSTAAAMLYIHDCEAHGIDPDPVVVLHLLLHDAHEAYTGDMSTPMQYALTKRVPGFREAMKKLQAEWDAAIYRRLAMPEITEHQHALIKHYDLLMLYIERHIFLVDPPLPWVDEATYMPMVFKFSRLFNVMRNMASQSREVSALGWLVMLRAFATQIGLDHAAGLADAAHERINK